jgi:DNA-binding LytR/AlgR family response regulator
MLKFALIDDDKKLLIDFYKMLESIFIKHDLDAKVVFYSTNVVALLDYVKKSKVDVLILDIDLKSNLSGLEIAEIVRKSNKDCYIIFETAHLEYGLIAYKYKTFDFICKPVTSQRLEECVLRLFEDISELKKKFIRIDNKNTIISEADISYIKKDGMKLIFHTETRDYEIYSSFLKIQESLPQNFVRCHKSFIANINNVTKVESNKNIVYFNNSSCDIGPKYKNKFLEVIKNYGNIK